MNVVYVPWGKGIDEMITYGAAWLHEQSGDKLVLLAAKMIYQRNPLLPRLTVGAKVAAPSTLSRLAWRGGPVFAPWPDEKVLSVISDQLGERVTAVCLLPWGEDPYAQAWLAAHQAVNLINGQTQTPRDDLLSPVVTVAMEGLSSVSRHNGLDRDRAIGMLLALASAGYRFEVNALVAWALAHGFTGSAAQDLRDYATKSLAGRQFRIREFGGWRADIVAVWEQKARERGLVATEPDVETKPDAERHRSRDW